MKVGVYNRHWTTLGGGEKYGGGIAQALQNDYDVELVTHDEIDVGVLAERLALDLGRTAVRVIGDEPRAVTVASGDYDIFVNTSYLSSDPSLAPAGIYVVHFPSPLEPETTLVQRLLWRVTGARRASSAIEWGTGFYPPTTGRLRSLIWTDGAAEVFVYRRTGTDCDLRLSFSRARPASLGTAHVEIEVDGRVVRTLDVPPATSRFWRPIDVRVAVPERDDGPSRVLIRSDTFIPAEIDGGSDTRHLGVPLTMVTTDPRQPGGTGRNGPRTYVDSYSAIVANAEFTRGFITRWWNVDSEVVYPPVTMQPRGDKTDVILSVGRFFRPEHGHSKKQLEMVHGFRRLVDGGLSGWELHLVGGCAAADEPYLAEVQAAAAGLPVVVHANATGAELRDLYKTASVFWSLTGLGEDPRVHPARFEHFGITTVEAMSAGAVPVVLRAGGQVEIVRDGTDGFLIDDLDGLVRATRRVADDPALRAQLSAQASTRAEYFSMPRFCERFRAVVERVAPTH